MHFRGNAEPPERRRHARAPSEASKPPVGHRAPRGSETAGRGARRTAKSAAKPASPADGTCKPSASHQQATSRRPASHLQVTSEACKPSKLPAKPCQKSSRPRSAVTKSQARANSPRQVTCKGLQAVQILANLKQNQRVRSVLAHKLARSTLGRWCRRRNRRSMRGKLHLSRNGHLRTKSCLKDICFVRLSRKARKCRSSSFCLLCTFRQRNTASHLLHRHGKSQKDM